MSTAQSTATIDQAIQFAASINPAFMTGLKGASPTEIAALEEASGTRPLPPDYREFLERMGHRLGMLELADAKFDIAAVTAWYAHDGSAAPGYFLIGRAKGDPYIDIYLEIETGLICSFPPPPAVRFKEFAETHLRYMAGSLPQWIALAALRQWRFASWPKAAKRASARPNPGKLAEFDSALQRAGMQSAMFSNRFAKLLEGPGCAVTATEYPGGRLIASVHAENAETFASVDGLVKRLVA